MLTDLAGGGGDDDNDDDDVFVSCIILIMSYNCCSYCGNGHELCCTGGQY